MTQKTITIYEKEDLHPLIEQFENDDNITSYELEFYDQAHITLGNILTRPNEKPPWFAKFHIEYNE